MNRPKCQVPQRPRMASAKVARSAKDAAISLVRLEFDASRLRQGLRQANDRAALYASQLGQNSAERRHLLGVIERAEHVAQTGQKR